MHGCGHDMHTSMLLCAAEVLYGKREKLCGNVRLLFQPAEEILSGAKMCIENGALDGVSSAMTVHVMTATDIPTGRAILSYDSPCAPSADFFKITVKGKGCHGSSPVLGIDPISASCRIVQAIDYIKTHEIGIHEKAVLTIGEIHGGNSANAIPDFVTMRGTLRCFDEKTRKFYKQRFEEITKGIAGTFRCDATIEYTSCCPALINNPELLARTKENLTELLCKENVITIKDTKSNLQGSEDFAYIATEVPSAYIYLSSGFADARGEYTAHNPKVRFNEDCLPMGAAVYAQCADRWLKENAVE